MGWNVGKFHPRGKTEKKLVPVDQHKSGNKGGKSKKVTKRIILIATQNQNWRYILPSTPPPLSQWIKKARNGPSQYTQYVIHALEATAPRDFQLAISKKASLFSLEMPYSSTSTKSLVFLLLTTKRWPLANSLHQYHALSTFLMVCFAFLSFPEGLPAPRQPAHANRFLQQGFEAFLPL